MSGPAPTRARPLHRVLFLPSGRSALVAEGRTLLEATQQAKEPIAAECAGRGACGRCLVQPLEQDLPEAEEPQLALACQTRVRGPLRVRVLGEPHLPRLVSRDDAVDLEPLEAWAPWPLSLDPLCPAPGAEDLGVALDLGTTTLKLLLLRLAAGRVVAEAAAYNPQIALGADVISRIVAAEKGRLDELGDLVRRAVVELIDEAAGRAGVDAQQVRAYAVAGNLTMIHLLLGVDPSGIRRVPSAPRALAFDAVPASDLGWPGSRDAMVRVLPAAGGWIGGDIVVGVARAGMPRAPGPFLYVDLGTNGEIAVGGEDFAVACACSAGPAFEGGGIQQGMRADRGAIAGATIDVDAPGFALSVIGGRAPRGICGSGLIGITDALLRAAWIDRAGRLTPALPAALRVSSARGEGIALDAESEVMLWERDLSSLIRAKAAIFAGIRTLLRAVDMRAGDLAQVVVSGNFGRFLNLQAAIGIGLLPDLPRERYAYLGNGSLEGAALALLSCEFGAAVADYLRRITYVDLASLCGYMDEFVGASFLPHTDEAALRG